MTLAPALPIPDRIIWPRLTALLGCLCNCIAERNLPEPCVCGVMPGALVATEYCNPCSGDKCGMAWVRLDSIFPSTVFPVQDVLASGCNAMLAFTVEMGVVRCAPVGGEHGEPPDPAIMLLAAELQVNDALAMREAVKCCFGKPGMDKTMFGAYQPVGPEGGCVGGTWTVSVSPQVHYGNGAGTYASQSPGI